MIEGVFDVLIAFLPLGGALCMWLSWVTWNHYIEPLLWEGKRRTAPKVSGFRVIDLPGPTKRCECCRERVAEFRDREVGAVCEECFMELLRVEREARPLLAKKEVAQEGGADAGYF